MNRHQLDAFCAQHRLPSAAVSMALQLTGNRPDTAAWRTFVAKVLRAAGIGAIGAGVIFFVAANWQDYGLLGRFILLQSALLVSIAVALWRPPPKAIGQSALVLATLFTGALLALFGQSYQTGADVHELFFTWAILTLPFALAGVSGALWAVWWGVLNIAFALLCGWLGPDAFFWRFIAGWNIDRSALLMLPCIVNLLAAAGFSMLRKTQMKNASPLWLPSFLASIGVLYGTVATMMVITRDLWRLDEAQPGVNSAQGLGVVLGFAAISAAIGLTVWLRKRDVFPMALLAASWIGISTVWIARSMRFNDIGSFFVVSFWLIATSTAAGVLLMRWVRRWKGAEPTVTNVEGAAA
jgi:uncharacterized membrane protein